jgi:spermidine synthase
VTQAFGERPIVELDPGVIAAGRRYFGLLETDKVHFIESDRRVYLNGNRDLYDLVLLDAYRELSVPFQLLTREFYELVKARLAPGGAVASNLSGNTNSTSHLWQPFAPCSRPSMSIPIGRTRTRLRR